jgi:sugar phosphate isomerase/epimerase
MNTNRHSLRWGFSSMGAPELSFEENCALAARLGCPNIELRTLENSVDLPSVFAHQFPQGSDPRKVAAAHNVQVICLNSSFKLTDGSDQQREQLLAFASWADRLGAPYVRVFGGGKWGDDVEGETLARAEENLAWWRQAKTEAGLQADIILESHDAFSGSSQILRLIEVAGGNLPVIWDTHHTWKLAGEAPRETWSFLGEHIRHVHVKDSVSRPSDRHPYTYVHLGTGEFPLKETVSLLQEVEFAGVVSIEWEKLWHSYLDPLETALEQCRKIGLW